MCAFTSICTTVHGYGMWMRFCVLICWSKWLILVYSSSCLISGRNRSQCETRFSCALRIKEKLLVFIFQIFSCIKINLNFSFLPVKPVIIKYANWNLIYSRLPQEFMWWPFMFQYILYHEFNDLMFQIWKSGFGLEQVSATKLTVEYEDGS